MARNRITEKGERSLTAVSYSVTIFFMITTLIPLLWMIMSSVKDNQSIDAYPPKWLPSIPHAVKVTIDYSGMKELDEVSYELEAMQATWFPWRSHMLENIGQVEVYGVKDGTLIYKSRTLSSSFFVGQPMIVPSTLYNNSMMKNNLDNIRSRSLSEYSWYGGNGKSLVAKEGYSTEKISQAFHEFYNSSAFVTGKVVSIEESPKLIRILDSYLSLNKLSQESTGNLGFFRYFLNSVIITVSVVCCQLIFGGIAGYALSHLVRSSRLQFILLMFFLGTIMIPGISLILPLYLEMNVLNLTDTLLAVILPHTAWGIVIYLFKGFFDQLPKELMQAARVDGASELRTFTQLVIPLSIPAFTVVAVMTTIPVWNEFVWPLIVTHSPKNWTFTVALNDMQSSSAIRENTIMASSFLAMVPMFVVFITCQRYIEKGIAFSGVKG